MKNRFGCEIDDSTQEDFYSWGYSEGEIYGDGSY